jgi:lysophospholipase L1-like esterase
LLNHSLVTEPGSSLFLTPGKLERRSIANGQKLRILPLGDSITWGFASSDGNGYRQDLLNLLSGNSVQYAGSQRSGNMADNYNEGHPGAVISQIAGYASASLPQRPNVVLLMAGTNDVNSDKNNPGGAPQRLGSLIDEIIGTCPDAAVLVAQLTPIANAASSARVQTFNAAVPGIVASRANAGKHVLVVNMGQYVTVNDLGDGLHPNGQ